MDDLFSKLQEILSSEQGRQQLNDLAGALGMSGDSTADNQQPQQSSAPPPSNNNTNQNNNVGGFDFSQLAGMFGGNNSASQNGGNNTAQNNGGGGFDFSQLAGMFGGNNSGGGDNPLGGLDMGMLLKVQQMISAMNQRDDVNSNLLMALRPHFSDERKTKIDQAVKMLKLFAVLPLLKESGLLGGLFSNGTN